MVTIMSDRIGSLRRMQVRVTGEVQGVCFRMVACQQARQLQLTGLVRNCVDGSVEIVAEGEVWALGQLVAWCHQGPPMSEVTGVEEFYGDPTGEFSGFDIAF